MIGEVLSKNKYIYFLTSPLFHALQHDIIKLIYLFIIYRVAYALHICIIVCSVLFLFYYFISNVLLTTQSCGGYGHHAYMLA